MVRSMVEWRGGGRGVEGYDTRLASYGGAWRSAARTYLLCLDKFPGRIIPYAKYIRQKRKLYCAVLYDPM